MAASGLAVAIARGQKGEKMDKDVIYRQDAIDAMWKIRRKLQMLDDTHKADRVMHGIYLANKALKQLPPAPERKAGKWTKENACEFCGFQPWFERDIHTLSFCPNCGADMRGEQDDEQRSY